MENILEEEGDKFKDQNLQEQKEEELLTLNIDFRDPNPKFQESISFLFSHSTLANFKKIPEIISSQVFLNSHHLVR